jgi:hypothetical protein
LPQRVPHDACDSTSFALTFCRCEITQITVTLIDTRCTPRFRRSPFHSRSHMHRTCRYDPHSKTFLLLSIGNGTASNPSGPINCNKTTPSTSHPDVAHNSATAGGLSGSERERDPPAAGIVTLSYADSPNGPWTTMADPVLAGRPGKWDAFVTNPSVYVFSNGTVLLAYRGGWNPWHVGVAVAPSFRGPFVRVSDTPVSAPQTE